jgi:hypothetical protein
MKHTLSSLIATSLLLSNCASIVSKSSWPVSVQSQPSGMEFVVKKEDGTVISNGKTPQIVTLDSGAGYFKAATYLIEVSKNGKVTGRQSISATMSGWYLGNILLGAGGIVIGMLIVDPASGAMYRLPESVTIYATSLTSNDSNSLTIASIDTLSTEQRKKLVRL